MRNITKIVLIFAITLASCNPNARISEDEEGSGSVITEKRTITENFDKVIATDSNAGNFKSSGSRN